MKTLSYTDIGDGATVVLLHGFCENRRMWEAFSAILSMKFRVITIDLPGFGESEVPMENSSTTLEGFADAVRQTLEKLHVNKTVLIGHSMGGYTALAFAEKYPEMLSGLGLFHSTAFPDTDEKKALRDKTVQFIRQNGTSKFIKSFFPGLFSEKTKQEFENQIQFFINDAAGLPELSLIAALEAMKNRPDRRHVLEASQVPVLFILGKDDNSVTLQQSLEECHLPADSSVHFLAETGHMGMVEKMEKTRDIVFHFIDYCSPKSPQ